MNHHTLLDGQTSNGILLKINKSRHRISILGFVFEKCIINSKNMKKDLKTNNK